MIASIAAAAIVTATPAPAPILLDARCEATEWAGAARTDIGGGVSLLAHHDARFVYLCMPLPKGSFGSLDLWIQPQAGGALVNLHVSAQVGERTRTDAGWPAWRFGNHQGWYGPTVPFGGMGKGEDGQNEARFRASEAREVQLSRARFGDGPWRVRVNLEALGEKQDANLTWPRGSRDDDPVGWAELRLSG